MFSQVPVGRRVSDTLYMAPGVSTGGSVGTANPSISGGSGLENQYVIDGVNVTNQGYGALGSYSIVFGSLGNATPFDFVKEVQVKTGGYEAEFGQSTGGVVNVVTKSGIERRSAGRCSATRGRRRLEGDWTQITVAERHDQHRSARTSATSASKAAARSSRIALFFFGAIDPSWETRTFAGAARRFPLLQPVRATARPRNGGRRRTRRRRTYQLTNAHRFDASFFGDPSKGDERAAARQRAARARHARLQLADLRRPQPDRPLRRRAVEQLPGRGVLRARAERHQRGAVGQHVARHRSAP